MPLGLNVVYLSDSIIPSKNANSINVMNMANAFSSHKSVDNTLLLAPNVFWDMEKINCSEFEYYGVDNKFDLVKPFLVPGFKQIYKFLCSKYLKLANIIITRNAEYLDIIPKNTMVFLELHRDINEKVARKINEFTGEIKIIAISKALAAQLHKKLVHTILVLHDAVNFNRVPKKTNTLNLKDINIGYFGSLCTGRGVDIILSSAEQLPHYKFHIYGGDDSEIKKFKAGGNIIFHGHVPAKEVLTTLCKMDILVMPYQYKTLLKDGKTDTSKWMSPMKMFEYMASGVPIISSDLSVLREVLENETNAYLVDATDVSKWVSAVKKLLSDTNKYDEIRMKALKDVSSQYTWDCRVDKIIESYLLK